jgi:hypothetical protein
LCNEDLRKDKGRDGRRYRSQQARGLQFVLVAMLVVGSPSTVTGAVGGTFLVSLLMEAARRFESAMNGQVFGPQEIALGLAILAVLYWRRGGLFGLLEADEFLAERLRSRATRHAARLLPAAAPVDSSRPALDRRDPASTGVGPRGLGSNEGRGREPQAVSVGSPAPMRCFACQ